MRVVIPARNEGPAIGHALDALRGQVDLTGRPLPPDSFDVTVLASNCDDETAAVTRDYADRYPFFPLRVLEQTVSAEYASIGAARRSLIDDACARFEAAGQEGIVASTRARAVVAPDWIAATLAEFDNGADAVCGRVVLAPEQLARMTPRQRELYLHDTGYHLLLAELGARVDPNPGDPAPCHHQHRCASLAVRTEVYRRAGSISGGASLDDALWEALEQIDASIRHSPHVRVTTPIHQLADIPEDWSGAAPAIPPALVEPVARSIKRLQLRRELRNRWGFRRSHQELVRGARMDAFVFFGAFLADVRPEIERYLDEAAGNDPVPLRTAIVDLRKALTTHH